MTTHSSAVWVWPIQETPLSRMPRFVSRPLSTLYWPLKIQLHKKPMAMPGMIQFTSVRPRSSSLPLKPWLSRMAQMKPGTKGMRVASTTKRAVVPRVGRK